MWGSNVKDSLGKFLYATHLGSISNDWVVFLSGIGEGDTWTKDTYALFLGRRRGQWALSVSAFLSLSLAYNNPCTKVTYCGVAM